MDREEYDCESEADEEDPDFMVPSRSLGEVEETEHFGGGDFPRPPVATNIDWNDSPDVADFIVTAESDELSFAIAVAASEVGRVGGRTTFGINNSRYKFDCKNRK